MYPRQGQVSLRVYGSDIFDRISQPRIARLVLRNTRKSGAKWPERPSQPVGNSQRCVSFGFWGARRHARYWNTTSSPCSGLVADFNSDRVSRPHLPHALPPRDSRVSGQHSSRVTGDLCIGGWSAKAPAINAPHALHNHISVDSRTNKAHTGK